MPPTLQGLVSRVLRGGVYLSAAILILGLLDAYLRGPAAFSSVSSGTSVGGFVPALLAGDPSALLLLGLAVLVLTPLSRVVISVLLFAAVRDRAFTLVTLTVLAILGASVGIGGAHP